MLNCSFFILQIYVYFSFNQNIMLEKFTCLWLAIRQERIKHKCVKAAVFQRIKQNRPVVNEFNGHGLNQR